MPTLPEGADALFDIWPDRPPDGFHNDRTERLFPNPDPAVPERWIRNVTQPTLTRFPATAKPLGVAMLIVPGGAFHFVSIDNEGYDLARALAAAGIDGFVLKYRVAPMPEDDADIPAFLEMMNNWWTPTLPGQTEPPASHRPELATGRRIGAEDGRQAMRLLRANAGPWGIAGHRIGAVGFSAGGGIVADLALQAPADCRPDLVAPIYPAWEPSPIPADCPPLFLATAADDLAVAPHATARLAQMAHAAGAPADLHIYGNGGHGFGIRKQGKLSDRWFDEFLAWIASVTGAV